MQKQTKLENLEYERSLYKQLFETTTGKEVLKRLKKYCYYRQVTYGNGEWSAEHALYKEGKRAVLLHILNMLDDEIFQSIQQQIRKGEK